jgi:hypothetical protein
VSSKPTALPASQHVPAAQRKAQGATRNKAKASAKARRQARAGGGTSNPILTNFQLWVFGIENHQLECRS